MSEPVVLSYPNYLQQVLYGGETGYYTRVHQRVGRTAENDFYTASSFKPVFAPLIIAAAASLLREWGEPLDRYTFVEIGAEPGSVLLDQQSHPFAASAVRRYGDELDIPERAIVFANELLDAQAFHRLVYLDGSWRELGVQIDQEQQLREVLLPKLTPEVTELLASLPRDCPEGYHIDLPLGAEQLLSQIVQSGWRGLLLLADYGKTWEELIHSCPQGTARAYHRHRQHNDLLAHPGEQDITCHVCWDRLESLLKSTGFTSVYTERQEAFLIQHAETAIKAMLGSDPLPLDSNRRALHELLHPARMGHAFQVLRACRL